MTQIRELSTNELRAVSGGVRGLLGQIEDLLSGQKDVEKHERKHGLIEKLERFLGLE